MNEETFLKLISELGIQLSEKQRETLKKYSEKLLNYNKHTNLTAIKTIEEVYLKHFYDSLTLIKIKNFSNEKILDIGTGAGFPGLVLAIVFPNTEVYLLDSNHKKIDFLKETIEELEIKNAVTIYEELRIILEISFVSLKINGSFLAMKSSLEEELDNAKDAIDMLKGKINAKKEFDLPNAAGKRTILEIIKLASTNKIYPRPYNNILKKPLKKKNN